MFKRHDVEYMVETVQKRQVLPIKYLKRLCEKDYGFYDECLHKYSDVQAYNALMEVFDYLPIAAVVENKFLCMHGGLPENISHVEDITKINRFQEIPFEG